VTVRELSDLDAAELTWSCLDDVDSQPTVYLVQSTSTTEDRHRTTRRHLPFTDDVQDAAAWRAVIEVSLHFFTGTYVFI